MIALLVGSLLVLYGCSHVEIPTAASSAPLTKQQVISRVKRLPNSQEKQIALAVIKNPDTQYRIDRYGYPAWRWRGEDDHGSCVHIDPKSGEPYLENQFGKASRSAVPKYIDFGTDGDDWQCRIHVEKFGVDYQRNWSLPACDNRGRELLDELSTALKVSS
ncbi:MAG: hypothetical protein GY792_08565 [Gammaproteobacteria bacterium]|nr:hypothetical protein [Gammaproteobacteria bacterium]